MCPHKYKFVGLPLGIGLRVGPFWVCENDKLRIVTLWEGRKKGVRIPLLTR